MKEFNLNHTTIVMIGLLVAAVALAGCSGLSIPLAPAPTATPIPEPTATPVPEPTATPEPEAAPAQVEVVHTFNAARGELPEGVILDKDGNIYVTLGAPGFAGGGLGEVWKIRPDGTETVLAEFDYPGVSGPAGIAVNDSGDVYYAYPASDPTVNGVYRMRDGSPERLPGTENTVIANGLAFDDQGNLYASDSILGAIWRIPPAGDAPAEMWAEDPLLGGCSPDEAMGANGIVFWDGGFYVANTMQGLLVRVPIQEDGSAGEAAVVAGDVDNGCEIDDLWGMDGIALDVNGSVYALLVMQNQLVRINPSDGSHEVLLTEEDGLWNPASLVFGTGEEDRQHLYIANYAVIPPEPANSLGPAVLRYDVGVDGLPSLPSPEAAAPAQIEVVAAFDGTQGGLPEGITIDRSGNIYVSVGYPFWFPAEEGFGEIWQISPDGEKSVLAAFPGGPAAAGLVVSPFKDLYFAYPNPMDPDTNGVYGMKVGENEPQRLPGSENIGLANGLAINPTDMYVSDSALGAIWRIPRNGTAELWLQHEWLAGCDPETDPVGANGVALWPGGPGQRSRYVLVASTSRGLLVRIPILGDRSAGEPEIVAGIDDCDPEFDDLDGMDGIALDVGGNVFALLVMQHKLVRIDPSDGSYTVLATEEDGLFNPASIAFGANDNRTSVFLTNFALLPPAPANSLGPGVLKYDVGVRGMLP